MVTTRILPLKLTLTLTLTLTANVMRHGLWVMRQCVMATALTLGSAFMMHIIYQERGSMHILVKP